VSECCELERNLYNGLLLVFLKPGGVGLIDAKPCVVCRKKVDILRKLVWYAANHPELHLAHLEQRMRQSGDWKGDQPLDRSSFQKRLNTVIDALDVNQARREVAAFTRYPQRLEVWSRDFFRDVSGRIRMV
jgi:hypothetical protein